ncbi:MAG: hypothetical protein IRY90_03945, partial [Actinomadura rubrobrunea]|nr:hypothetical protein [Actinomadura rubrobrunea]
MAAPPDAEDLLEGRASGSRPNGSRPARTARRVSTAMRSALIAPEAVAGHLTVHDRDAARGRLLGIVLG